MKRAIGLLALTLLAAGCFNGGKPAPEAQAPTGKPAVDEARSCIVAYLAQVGWQGVELAAITESPQLPSGAQISGGAWAYTFTANYTNVLGERTTSENWVAVLERIDGQPTVKSCFDRSGHLVSGNHGNEVSETASLVPQPPADAPPPIVAPKP